MTKVIAISGKMRHGKDWVASTMKTILEQRGKTVEVMAHADTMKFLLATTLGITEEQLDEYKNNTKMFKVVIIDNHDGTSEHTTDCRELLQRFGNDAMKTVFGEDIWAKTLATRIAKSRADVILIPGLRFHIEIDNLPIDTTLIRVFNNSIVSEETHSSEIALDNYQFDFYLDNTDKQLTEETVEKLLNVIT